MKKLFVGNIPHSHSEEDLKELFSKFTSIKSVKLLIDRETGRSRGFGFVEFDSDQEAEAAIAEFNGQLCEGRELVVNEARPMEKRDRPERSGQGRRY